MLVDFFPPGLLNLELGVGRRVVLDAGAVPVELLILHFAFDGRSIDQPVVGPKY